MTYSLENLEIIERNGIYFCIPKKGKSLCENAIFNRGIWEPSLTQKWKSLLKKDLVVIDAGSHTGYYAFIAGKVMENTGRIYAVEPNLWSFTKLCIGLQYNWFYNKQCGNVIPLYYALTSKEKETTDLGRERGKGYIEPYFSKRLISIDEIINGGRCDLVKMDIEGWEVFAIKGMKKTLENNPQLKMVMQFHRGSKKPCLEILRSLGFDIKDGIIQKVK